MPTYDCLSMHECDVTSPVLYDIQVQIFPLFLLPGPLFP